MTDETKTTFKVTRQITVKITADQLKKIILGAAQAPANAGVRFDDEDQYLDDVLVTWTVDDES